MSDRVEQIGERLKGLRDALDFSPEKFAESCGILLEDYLQYESGKKDPPLNVIKSIASNFNIDTSVLMFDNEPRMNSYFLTRKGNGQAVERVKAYQYQTLAGGFTGRKAEIFEVTVEPGESPMYHNSHKGQEFNLVLEGRMLLIINKKELTLEEGDSIYFDSSLPHGMKALDGKKVRFITVVL